MLVTCIFRMSRTPAWKSLTLGDVGPMRNATGQNSFVNHSEVCLLRDFRSFYNIPQLVNVSMLHITVICIIHLSAPLLLFFFMPAQGKCTVNGRHWLTSWHKLSAGHRLRLSWYALADEALYHLSNPSMLLFNSCETTQV